MAMLGKLLADINLQGQQEKAELANALLQEELKQRENFGYGFANALSGLPQQQSYGSWLSDVARAFGSAYTGRRDAAIERARENYKNITGQTAADINAAFKLAEVAGQQETLAKKANQEFEKNQKSFLKDTPQIGMARSLDAMLAQNNSLYDTFDMGRKGREAYAKQSGFGSALSDLFVSKLGGDAETRKARKIFDTLKKQSVVELRQQMKGQGQISDNETNLLRTMENASNPYEFELAGSTLRQIMYNKAKANADLYGVDNPLDFVNANKETDYSKYGF